MLTRRASNESGSGGLVVFFAVTLALLMVLIALMARHLDAQRAEKSTVAVVDPPVPPPPVNIRGPDVPTTPKFGAVRVDEPKTPPKSPLGGPNDVERAERADQALRRVVEAVARFRHIVGRNPRDLSELARPISGHADGILGAAGAPADGWDRPFQYGGRTGSTGPVWIKSHGADGAEGGLGVDRDLVGVFDG